MGHLDPEELAQYIKAAMDGGFHDGINFPNPDQTDEIRAFAEGIAQYLNQYDEPQEIPENDGSHGERWLNFPAALLAGDHVSGTNNHYFYTAGTFSSPRGFYGSRTNGRNRADIPLSPWLRHGDRVLAVRYRVKRSTNDGTIHARIKSTNFSGTQSEISSASVIGTSSGENDWIEFDENSTGFPFFMPGSSVNPNPVYLGIDLPSTSTLGDARLYFVRVKYDRP